jgi:hypothetical protein
MLAKCKITSNANFDCYASINSRTCIMMFNTSVLIAWLLISSNINLTVGVEVSQNSNETRYEETSYEQVQDPFEESYDNPTWRYVDAYDRSQLKDWGFYNYSSDERYARRSIVEWGGKTYDPLSFKGGMNNTYGMYILCE